MRWRPPGTSTSPSSGRGCAGSVNPALRRGEVRAPGASRPAPVRGGEGDEHPERRAFAGPALDLDPPAVRADDVLHDREPEAGPALVAAAPLVHPVEALEDPRQVLGGDPLARVG